VGITISAVRHRSRRNGWSIEETEHLYVLCRKAVVERLMLGIQFADEGEQ
jgi:hypothetical protein